MAIVRAIPRGSWATIVGSLIIAMSVLLGSTFMARGENHDQTFYACLYAGSLSQVGTTPPSSCGRGSMIQWNSQGVAGLPGVDGVSGYEIVVNDSTLSPGGTYQSSGAVCPDGKEPIGGGIEYTAGLANVDYFVILGSHPFEGFGPDGSRNVGWMSTVRNTGPNTISWRTHAVCAFMAPDPAP